MKKTIIGVLVIGSMLVAGSVRGATLAPAPQPCDTVVGTPFLTLTQPITEPDSGNHGDWANDTFTENVKIWLGTDNTTFCASGDTSDGTFVTTGPSSPEAGASLSAGITGTFTGGETWVFPEGTATTTPAASLTLDADNSNTDGQFNNWQSHVFSQTVGASTYAFTYVVDGHASDTWTNADSASSPGGNSGDIIDPPTVTDTTTGTEYTTLQAAIDGAHAGNTIELSANQTLSSEVTINKPLTLNGNGHTLFAPFDNSANDNANNAALGIVEVNGDVTVNNLVVDGTNGIKLHGINIFDAGNVALNDVTTQNNSKSGITVNGANVTVNNVTTKNNTWGGINADLASDAVNPATTLTVTGTMSQTETGPDIWRDNDLKPVTVNVNSQYSSQPYTHDTSIVGTIWGINTATVSNETELRAALGNSLVNTITLSANITLAAELDITRSVTIDGAGHTLGASFNGASVIQITSNDVTLKNLAEDATGTTGNRGINVYKVTGALLDHVTVENNAKNGIVVNGSTVTVNTITTKNNAWGGIDVDLGSGVTTPALLTVNGVSAHSENVTAIRIDNTAKDATVVDTNNQYSFTDSTVSGITTRDYVLNGNISVTNPQVAVVSTTQPVTVTVDTAAVNPQIDVHALITTAGQATLPQITITSDNANVSIPASTVVTSSDSNWDGKIDAPTVTTQTVTVPGFTTAVAAAVEIGSSNSDLTFDKAVKLTFAGQAGKLIGWYNHAGTFREITSTCAADDQTTGDALAAGTSCKIDSGADLVVWTKHFSTFVAYTQTAIGVSSGGGDEGGHRQDVSGLVASGGNGAGQVLGAFTTADNQAQIALIKSQLISLISQLITRLQAQLAAAIAAGQH